MSIIQDRLSDIFWKGIENKEMKEQSLSLIKQFDQVLRNKSIPTFVTVEVINRVLLDLSKKDKSFAKILAVLLAKTFPDVHEQYHFIEFK